MEIEDKVAIRSVFILADTAFQQRCGFEGRKPMGEAVPRQTKGFLATTRDLRKRKCPPG